MILHLDGLIFGFGHMGNYDFHSLCDSLIQGIVASCYKMQLEE